MKALVKKERRTGLWLEEVPQPEVGINDVLIQVDRTGICGTDLHIYKWDDWAQRTIPTPMVVGHEFVGEVVQVGSNVKDFFTGELVSAEGHVVCGRCRNCLAGRKHLCKDTQGIGVNRPGAFAEFISVPMTNVWHHRNGIDRDVASIFDPFGNAVHTALSFPLLGEDVLITGAGPIGIMAPKCFNTSIGCPIICSSPPAMPTTRARATCFGSQGSTARARPRFRERCWAAPACRVRQRKPGRGVFRASQPAPADPPSRLMAGFSVLFNIRRPVCRRVAPLAGFRRPLVALTASAPAGTFPHRSIAALQARRNLRAKTGTVEAGHEDSGARQAGGRLQRQDPGQGGRLRRRARQRQDVDEPLRRDRRRRGAAAQGGGQGDGDRRSSRSGRRRPPRRSAPRSPWAPTAASW